MKYRKLRIAWSVVWGSACVVLIVLWVRSYWWTDSFSGGISTTTFGLSGTSISGELLLGTFRLRPVVDPIWQVNVPTPDPLWQVRTGATDEAFFFSAWKTWKIRPKILWGFGFYHDANDCWVMIPDWLIGVAFATLGVGPWIPGLRRQFSLRTMLIATTLVAVVLGLSVWSARQ